MSHEHCQLITVFLQMFNLVYTLKYFVYFLNLHLCNQPNFNSQEAELFEARLALISPNLTAMATYSFYKKLTQD